MPIYEYVCDDCQARYERIVMAQDQAVTCPHCGSGKGTLQLSVFSAGRGNGREGGKSEAAPQFPAAGGCGRGTCGCH